MSEPNYPPIVLKIGEHEFQLQVNPFTARRGLRGFVPKHTKLCPFLTSYGRSCTCGAKYRLRKFIADNAKENV